METAATGSDPVSTIPSSQPSTAIAKMLTEFLQKSDNLSAIAIGFIQKDGSSAVQSTPMPAMHINHLLTLFERKVARIYDRALAAAEQPRSPTQAMSPQSPKTAAAQLPRKVRRQVAAAQRKILKKSRTPARLAGPPLPAES